MNNPIKIVKGSCLDAKQYDSNSLYCTKRCKHKDYCMGEEAKALEANPVGTQDSMYKPVDMAKVHKEKLRHQRMHEAYNTGRKKAKLARLREDYKTADEEERVLILKQVEEVEETDYKLYK